MNEDQCNMNNTTANIKIPHNTILFDEINCLLHRESLYCPSFRWPPSLHIRNRHQIIQWFYKLVDYFDYDREVAAISIDLLDRFVLLQNSFKTFTADRYKVIAMTCLYLAVKIYIGVAGEGKCQEEKPFFSLEEYIRLHDVQMQTKDIADMELCILGTLQWKVNPVSSMCFVHYFLRLGLPLKRSVMKASSKQERLNCKTDLHQKMGVVREVLYKLALSFAEYAIYLPMTTLYFRLDCDRNGNMSYKAISPSIVAYASILLAMEMLSYSALPSDLRESFVLRCMQLRTPNHFILHPDQKDVKEIKARMQDYIQPKMGLGLYDFCEKFPILLTAMKEGILMRSFCNQRKEEFYKGFP